MFIVHVSIHVKEEYLEAFKAATIDNAENSVNEPGVARFDVIQQMDDPTRFMLVEVYHDESDTGSHKETAHYARWRDVVESMLVSERTRVFYRNIFPDDRGWA